MYACHTPLRIAVIGGSALVREVLQGMLAAVEGFSVLGSARALADFATLTRTTRADVLVIDLTAVAEPSALRRVKDACPALAVVALGVENSEAAVATWARAGVTAFLTRDTTSEQLVDAVRRVGGGEVVCPETIVRTLVEGITRRTPTQLEEVTADLTRRERQVAELLGRGLSNKQIAGRLCIEVATVKTHVHRILGKLDVARRTEAVARLNV